MTEILAKSSNYYLPFAMQPLQFGPSWLRFAWFSGCIAAVKITTLVNSYLYKLGFTVLKRLQL